MIEKMEAKIDNHIKSILKKDSIDFYDYQILVGEINRQNAKAKEAKWNAEQEERNAALMTAMQNMICCGTK